jgi:hypothetical protein
MSHLVENMDVKEPFRLALLDIFFEKNEEVISSELRFNIVNNCKVFGFVR